MAEKTNHENKKSSIKDEVKHLARVLSGEMALIKEQERLENAKELAKKKHKKKLREAIREGDSQLMTEDEELGIEESEIKGSSKPSSNQKVVQKIKLYEWEAPIRLKVSFDTRSFMIVVAVSLAFILYLAILGHYTLMFVIIALLFFIYVSGTTEPLMVTHTITSRGIDSLDKLYEWYTLRNFYFTKKKDQYMLVVETKLRAPGKLIMLLDKKEMGPVFMLLQDKLLYKDLREPGRVHTMTFGEYVPFEDV